MSVFVCSDIHGQYEAYKKMMEKVSPSDTLYILGDVIDRGPDSIKILLDITERKNVVLLLGNHEVMLLDAAYEIKYKFNKDLDIFLNEPGSYKKYHWLEIWTNKCNGGKSTYKELQEISQKDREKLFNYLQSAYIQINTKLNNKSFFLCHSSYLNKKDLTLFRKIKNGIIPETKKYDRSMRLSGKRHDALIRAVWSSPFKNGSENIPIKAYSCYNDTIFLIGHVPVQTLGTKTPYIDKNIIDIDGGMARESRYPKTGTLWLISLDKLSLNENDWFSEIRI